MEPKFSRELGDLFTNSYFFINPLQQSDLINEFNKYNSEDELTEELKNHLKIARKRKRESKNILSNTYENSSFVIKDAINRILKERGIIK